MEKTEQSINRDYLKGLISEFDLGMAEDSNVAAQDQPSRKESEDICLPPLLVKAFQSGLEEELRDCNCGCGDGQHDCTQAASSSAHNGCGGCKHHG